MSMARKIDDMLGAMARAAVLWDDCAPSKEPEQLREEIDRVQAIRSELLASLTEKAEP
jgi:hypothetical protein